MAKLPPPLPGKNRQPGRDLKEVAREWLDKVAKLKELKESEMNLRKHLVSRLFPQPKEGTNRYMTEGIEAVMKHQITRKVDKVAWSTTAAELRKKGIPLDMLIEMEPTLVLKEYRNLDPRKRKLFEQILTIADGSPQLEINLG